MRMLMLGSGSYKSSLTYFRLVALGKQLSERDYDIRLVLPSADKYNNYTPDKAAKIPGITLIQPWQPATKHDILNLLPYLVTALIASIRARPQLIFIDKPTPISIIGLIPKFLFRAPMVLDLDDLGSEVMRLQNQSGLQVKLVAFCERLALRYADAVVVTSTYLESLVLAQYPDKPVLVLSNGVDPEVYKLDQPSEIRNAIYYFGALNRLSLIETFLRSLPATLRAVPDTQIYILGDGSAREETQQLVETLGIADHVTFSGWIQAEDLHRYVRTGDVAICMQPDIPTVRAASNLKVFQYMGLGSVAVVSDVGDLPQYVKAGQGTQAIGVVVPPEDPEALAQALITILKDKQGRKNMAQKARIAAEMDYAWSTLAGLLDQFIRKQTGRLQDKRNSGDFHG
jgi:glycosyltransferase involved in cell wall biosynthesis